MWLASHTFPVDMGIATFQDITRTASAASGTMLARGILARQPKRTASHCLISSPASTTRVYASVGDGALRRDKWSLGHCLPRLDRALIGR